jgi:predicted protein tyrosine phosphatase
MTNTAKIFADTCPYANHCQTDAKRLLFVCSAGMLRSPTCANAGTSLGYNTRACGSMTDLALIPLSVNLINWADKIIFMLYDNYDRALRTFDAAGYADDIKSKAVIWNIEDTYDWGDNNLFHEAVYRIKVMKL